MKKFLVIAAGGSGKRMKSRVPKQFLLLNGKPIIVHTIKKFLNHDKKISVVIAVGRNDMEKCKSTTEKYFPSYQNQIQICAGGKTRTESVRNALRKIQNADANDLICIHDAVRPFIDKKIIAEAFDIANKKGSAVCCVPATESLRAAFSASGGFGSRGGRTFSVNREKYFIVQTPQIFRYGILKKCYENAQRNNFTDDASLVEANGFPVHLANGSYGNIKITTPTDFQLAKILAKKLWG